MLLLFTLVHQSYNSGQKAWCQVRRQLDTTLFGHYCIFICPWFKGRIWASHNIQFLWERLPSLYDTALTRHAVSKREWLDSIYFLLCSSQCVLLFFRFTKLKFVGLLHVNYRQFGCKGKQKHARTWKYILLLQIY